MSCRVAESVSCPTKGSRSFLSIIGTFWLNAVQPPSVRDVYCEHPVFFFFSPSPRSS